MKKKIIYLSSFIILVLGIGIFIDQAFFKPTVMNSFIASKIYSSPANNAFTDDSFYKCVVDAYNSKNKTSLPYTTTLSDEQLETITVLNCDMFNKSDEKKIISVNGIEKLTTLTSLNVRDNELTELDVSKNTALTKLNANGNQLTELDVSKNTALTELDVEHNQLTNLDVSNNTILAWLDVYNNQLTNIDVSKNTALTYLNVPNNQLTNIDVSNNTALKQLYVSNNQLTGLNLSETIALESLFVSDNQLTELDVGNNTALKQLYVFNNQLTNIDVSNNTALIELNVYNNQLTSLDVSKNTSLTELDVENNKLTSIDVSNNTALKKLYVYNNQLTSLDVSKNTSLTELDVENNKLTSIDVSNNTALKKLYVSNNQLTNLNLGETIALESLYADNNQLKSIDVSKNTALAILNIFNNQLIELDVSNNMVLTELEVYKNSFITNLVTYKNKSINIENDNRLVRLPEGKNSTLTKISSDNENVIIDENNISIDKIGEYVVTADYKHNVSLYRNTYSGTYNIKVVEITSDKYVIDEDKEYIYTGTDVDNDTILSNINLDSGCNKVIEDNKLIIKYGEEILKTFMVINISSDKYKISDDKEYVYTGTDSDNNTILKNIKLDSECSKVIEDNKLVIKYKDSIINTFKVINISSDKFYVNDEFIYIGTDSDNDTILKNIKLDSECSKVIEDNKLVIKYKDDVIDNYLIYNIGFGNLKVSNGFIVIDDSILYNDFIDNIVLNDIFSYKIFNNDMVITDGTIDIDMVFKVYYNDNVIDSYTITDEYLNFINPLYVDDKYIYNVKLNTSVNDLLSLINTSGSVSILDNENVKKNNDLIGTGNIVSIQFRNETKKYIIVIKGDTTGDGKVSVGDVAKLYQYLKKKITMEDHFVIAGNVVDVDDEIKVGDVAKLYQFVKGKISSLE